MMIFNKDKKKIIQLLIYFFILKYMKKVLVFLLWVLIWFAWILGTYSFAASTAQTNSISFIKQISNLKGVVKNYNSFIKYEDSFAVCYMISGDYNGWNSSLQCLKK